MQGGRANVGRQSVNLSGKVATNLSGKVATKLSAGGQPQPVAHRPVAATPNVPRSGSREIARVDSAGLVEAGKQTTGGQQAQQVAPVLNNANSV